MSQLGKREEEGRTDVIFLWPNRTKLKFEGISSVVSKTDNIDKEREKSTILLKIKD